MPETFVDSSAWIGTIRGRDRFHPLATQSYRRLLRGAQTLVTTNLVVAETYELLRRWEGHDIGIRFLRLLNESARVEKIYSGEPMERQAEKILTQYADQDFSYVDAVSFAVMRQRRMSEAFTFDHHFQVAGFILVPG